MEDGRDFFVRDRAGNNCGVHECPVDACAQMKLLGAKASVVRSDGVLIATVPGTMRVRMTFGWLRFVRGAA